VGIVLGRFKHRALESAEDPRQLTTQGVQDELLG
jgi:hypothetical protein